MGTVWIKEFTGGLDVRRLAETSPGGTLIRAVDCHITRGGAVEQRADFVPVYTLPAGATKGLAAVQSGLVVFGHAAAPTMPAGVTYQRLQHPTGQALERVTYTELFRGRVHAVGQFSDLSSYMFYDGARVTDAEGPPDAVGSGNPTVLLTRGSKMYVGSGPNMFFSAVNDSTDFGAGPGVGSGVIVMSTHSQGMENLTGLAPYDDLTAVFARRTILIWVLDPDPNNNKLAQALLNTGCIAPQSVTQFGDGDVFYLDRSGVRSLRARDSSNSASTTDIGSPIDPLVAEQILTVGETVTSRAVGIIEPRDGRFWLALGDRIFVFSYFTSSKVSAWTEYRPGFTVDDMVLFNERVYLRAGDTIYVYGGLGDRFQYSANVGECWMPYLDADSPTRAKHLAGIDAAVRGTWELRVGMDPNDLNATDVVARVDSTTFPNERIPAHGTFKHVSPRFKVLEPVSSTEPAVLSSAVIHFERDAREDS